MQKNESMKTSLFELVERIIYLPSKMRDVTIDMWCLRGLIGLALLQLSHDYHDEEKNKAIRKTSSHIGKNVAKVFFVRLLNPNSE